MKPEFLRFLSSDKADPLLITINNDLLMVFAQKNEATFLDDLLTNGADVNSSDKNGKTAFMHCVEKGNINATKIFFKHHVRVDKTDTNGNTALMYATYRGNVEILKLLLDYGADINASNRDGYTPFLYAAKHGNLEIVKTLLESGGVDIDYTSKDDDSGWSEISHLGYTALMHAANNGHTLIVDFLLTVNADMNKISYSQYTALMLAANNGHVDVMNSLITHEADVHMTANSGSTALLMHAGSTALMHAAQNGHLEAMGNLLMHGADVNITNNCGYTALMYAAQNGHIEAVENLIMHGADVNKASNNGNTALMLVVDKVYKVVEKVYKNDKALIKLMIKNGADVDSVNNKGCTALMIAAQNDHVKFIKILLQNGAEVNKVESTNQDTALLLYVSYSHHGSGYEAVTLLIEAGANVNAKDAHGSTALMVASRRNQTEMITILLNSPKIDINAWDVDNCTALGYALLNGNHSAIALLTEQGATTDISVHDRENNQYKAYTTLKLFSEGKNPSKGKNHPSTFSMHY